MLSPWRILFLVGLFAAIFGPVMPCGNGQSLSDDPRLGSGRRRAGQQHGSKRGSEQHATHQRLLTMIATVPGAACSLDAWARVSGGCRVVNSGEPMESKGALLTVATRCPARAKLKFCEVRSSRSKCS